MNIEIDKNHFIIELRGLFTGTTIQSVVDDWHKQHPQFVKPLTSMGGQMLDDNHRLRTFYILRNDLGWRVRGVPPEGLIGADAGLPTHDNGLNCSEDVADVCTN